MLHVLSLFLVLISINLLSQSTAGDATDKELSKKAETLMAAATKAMGGQTYMNVRSERSRGLLTPYVENNPEKRALQTFVDYILLPDKERVEFKGQGRRLIQTNSGAQGWTYDSDSQILRDQTEEQRQRFQRGLRYQLDHIMRGGWSGPEVRLGYLARQEIWTRQFAEGVKITYSDGDEVSLFFDPQTSLPLALRFPRETEKDGRVMAENRFFKYVDIGGIRTPHVVDLFENGKQVLRINYEQREFNVNISEKIFVKPENPKELK
jgi:hypothetical protein